MTRIVINACYGGFGVSIEAMKALVERGSDVIATVTMEEYTRGNILPSFLAELVDAGDGYQTQKWARSLFKDGLVYYIEREREGRTDPILVNVVEELGEMANGPHAELKIVDVPDDVEWEIAEYDGIEWVAEKHRTWE